MMPGEREFLNYYENPFLPIHDKISEAAITDGVGEIVGTIRLERGPWVRRILREEVEPICEPAGIKQTSRG